MCVLVSALWPPPLWNPQRLFLGPAAAPWAGCSFVPGWGPPPPSNVSSSFLFVSLVSRCVFSLLNVRVFLSTLSASGLTPLPVLDGEPSSVMTPLRLCAKEPVVDLEAGVPGPGAGPAQVAPGNTARVPGELWCQTRLLAHFGVLLHTTGGGGGGVVGEEVGAGRGSSCMQMFGLRLRVLHLVGLVYT